MLQEMQQLASQRTSLQAENARLKKELEDTKKDRDQIKKAQQGIEQRVKASEAAVAHSAAQRESSEQEVTQLKAKMQELIGKFRETVQSMRQSETEGTTAKQALATRDRELKTCVDRNLALYHLNDEVLKRLDDHGVWSRVAEKEPFTRIKRVQLENLIDEYRSGAEDQRVAKPIPLPPGATGTAPVKPNTPSPTGSAEAALPQPKSP